jgi:WD repeat and SOF domain-containing protein 1
MQRVNKVLWSRDSKYILSASDEMNIRLWKAVAWEKLGKVSSKCKVQSLFDALAQRGLFSLS